MGPQLLLSPVRTAYGIVRKGDPVEAPARDDMGPSHENPRGSRICQGVARIPEPQGLSARPLYDPPQSRTDPFNHHFQLQWLQAHVPIVQLVLWSNYGKRLRRRGVDMTGLKVGVRFVIRYLHVFRFGPMVQLTDGRCRLVHIWAGRRFVRQSVMIVRSVRWPSCRVGVGKGTMEKTRKGLNFAIFIGLY